LTFHQLQCCKALLVSLRAFLDHRRFTYLRERPDLDNQLSPVVAGRFPALGDRCDRKGSHVLLRGDPINALVGEPEALHRHAAKLLVGVAVEVGNPAKEETEIDFL
jgi:hypothetical protein